MKRSSEKIIKSGQHAFKSWSLLKKRDKA